MTLAIPTTISMLVTTIYNMADTYFVSQLGTSASGAVGVVFGLMAIIQAFGFMLGQGGGSIISRCLGAKQHDKATRIASKAFFASFLSGLLIGILGFIFLDPLMRLLGSTETILPYARKYARFILAAAPLMTSSYTMNNIIRFEGRAVYGMIGLTTGGVLNIFGDFLLMKVFGMGIEGAGIATATAQLISFSILLSMFLRKKTACRISLSRVMEVVGEHDLRTICTIGFPSMLRQGLSSIGTMMLNNQAGVYGDEAVAAMAIVGRVCFFVFAVGLGIGQGFQPVCGFNYGAKKYGRVKQGFYFTWFMGTVLLGVMSLIGMFLSANLIGVFRDDPAVIEIGTFALRAQLVTMIVHPFAVCTNMMFQSVGKSVEATFLSSTKNGLAFIPALLILSSSMGLRGIELAQPIADVITSLISIPFAVHFLGQLSRDENAQKLVDK